jgi:hypothetical protein
MIQIINTKYIFKKFIYNSNAEGAIQKHYINVKRKLKGQSRDIK